MLARPVDDGKVLAQAFRPLDPPPFMTLRLFFSQMTIDTWVAGDRVDLQGEVITTRPSGVRLRLTPAALFKQASLGAHDLHGLVGKVKDQEAIDALGGEAFMSSVVIGEAAYDVEAGYVAIPADETADAPGAILAAVASLRA